MDGKKRSMNIHSVTACAAEIIPRDCRVSGSVCGASENFPPPNDTSLSNRVRHKPLTTLCLSSLTHTLSVSISISLDQNALYPLIRPIPAATINYIRRHTLSTNRPPSRLSIVPQTPPIAFKIVLLSRLNPPRLFVASLILHFNRHASRMGIC